jgi:hypothetical protein
MHSSFGFVRMTVPIVGQDEAEGDGCCLNKTEELSLTFGKTKKMLLSPVLHVSIIKIVL